MNQIKSAFELLKQTASDWMADNAPRLGASLAYYTVFSISPLMLIALGIAGLLFNEEVARKQIMDQVASVLGAQSAQAISTLLQSVHRTGHGMFATAVALITLLIGSTGVFVELQDALNLVWGVKPKPTNTWLSFLRNRLLSFAMVLAIGFLMLVSLILSAGLAAVGTFLGGLTPGSHIIWQAANFILSFAVITLLFALIFKVLPDVHIAWKDVWIGALLSAFLFTIGKFFLGLYLGRTGLASSFGAAGSIVVILVWVYYSAQILFFGAEFTQVYADRQGQRLKPVPYAEPIKPLDKVPAALKRRGEVSGLPLEPRARFARRRSSRGFGVEKWKIAIPVAALFAWLWLRARKQVP
jgi:membrane protein